MWEEKWEKGRSSAKEGGYVEILGESYRVDSGSTNDLWALKYAADVKSPSHLSEQKL
jgi:hypothetical protein